MSEDAQMPVSRASVSEDEPGDSDVKVPLAPTLHEVYSGYADDREEVDDRFICLAFKRFAIDGANEITRERLHDAFISMGFLTSTRERALDVSAEVGQFQNLDYFDFCGCVNKFAALERAAVRQSADACLAERGGVSAVDRVQQFLRSVGVCMPYSHVETARAAARLDHVRPEDVSTDDLLLTLAACRMKEGFTTEEVAAAHEVFGELEQVLVQHVSSSRWGPQAQASALLDGLLKFTGLYCVDYVDLLSDILPSDSAQQGVCFHEFLVWARRLRDPMTRDLWKCFRDFEAGGSGVVQLDAAISIAERFGISLLTDAVDELLSDLDMQNCTTLDFHALARFISAARGTHGFSRSEQEDLGAAFEKFDYDGTGELSHLQVLDLLRYLGNTTSVDQANDMINRVDFNGNGSMDIDEFLRLMRLMREQDIRCARRSFDDLSSSTGQLSTGSVGDALASMQLFPKSAMLAELLRDMPAEMCFTSFIRLHDQCRFRMNLEVRKHGGFPEETLLDIEQLWNCGGSTRKFTTVSELLWMLSDSHEIPANTQDGRHALLLRVEAAREAAIAAGVSEEEVSHGSTKDIGFYTFVHLIRGIVRDSEEDVVTREKEAVSFARFPNGEAAEFRRVFCEFAEQEEIKSSTWKQMLAREGKPVDKLLARLTMVPAVPQSAIPLLLKSMGAKVPSSKLHDINQFLAQSRSQGEADEDTIHFGTFLRLLRWMLNADFAGICGVMDFPRR
jgi:calmodulin